MYEFILLNCKYFGTYILLNCKYFGTYILLNCKYFGTYILLNCKYHDTYIQQNYKYYDTYILLNCKYSGTYILLNCKYFGTFNLLHCVKILFLLQGANVCCIFAWHRPFNILCRIVACHRPLNTLSHCRFVALSLVSQLKNMSKSSFAIAYPWNTADMTLYPLLKWPHIHPRTCTMYMHCWYMKVLNKSYRIWPPTQQLTRTGIFSHHKMGFNLLNAI